ncbi:microcystin-dependent protein [Bradyrhizobium sp. USDA 3240]
MTLYKWSRVAASDATADSSINWQEGQAPSSVNDSARAMMAATAKYRDDIAGAIVTSGSSTSYVLSSYQQFDSFTSMNGAMIAFTPHIINGGITVINVDGLGTRPLRTSPGTELQAGVIIQGTPYTATYNNSDAAWYLQGFFGNPYNVPLAAGMDYWGSTAPNSSFVFPIGQAISRATYATLFSLIGTLYGTGDGSTTFNLPDKRGRASAAVDNMGGTAALRLTSAYFGAPQLGLASGSESHTLTVNELPAHRHSVFLIDSGHSHIGAVFGSQSNSNLAAGGNPVPTAVNTAGIGVATTGISITSGDSVPNATLQAGGSVPHAIAQPTICCNYILRVI